MTQTETGWVADLYKWFTFEPDEGTDLHFFLKAYARNFVSDIHQACKAHKIGNIALVEVVAPLDLYTLAFYSQELQRLGSFSLTELGRTRKPFDWELPCVHYANESNMFEALPFLLRPLNSENYLENISPKLQLRVAV